MQTGLIDPTVVILKSLNNIFGLKIFPFVSNIHMCIRKQGRLQGGGWLGSCRFLY